MNFFIPAILLVCILFDSTQSSNEDQKIKKFNEQMQEQTPVTTKRSEQKNVKQKPITQHQTKDDTFCPFDGRTMECKEKE